MTLFRIDSWIVFRSWDSAQGARGPYWAHGIIIWDGSQSLKSGDIRECGVTVRLNFLGKKELGCAWEVVLSDMWFCQDFSGNGVCT